MKYTTDIQVIHKNICKVIEEAQKINRVVSVGKNANLENRNFCILRKSRLFKNKTNPVIKVQIIIITTKVLISSFFILSP